MLFISNNFTEAVNYFLLNPSNCGTVLHILACCDKQVTEHFFLSTVRREQTPSLALAKDQRAPSHPTPSWIRRPGEVSAVPSRPT